MSNTNRSQWTKTTTWVAGPQGSFTVYRVASGEYRVSSEFGHDLALFGDRPAALAHAQGLAGQGATVTVVR